MLGTSERLCAGKWDRFAGKCGAPGFHDGPVDQALFNYPKGMCLTGTGQLIVVDSMNSCIRSIDLNASMLS